VLQIRIDCCIKKYALENFQNLGVIQLMKVAYFKDFPLMTNQDIIIPEAIKVLGL
jgi:hypothetical protein